MGIRRAIERAIIKEDKEFAETRWSDALPMQSGSHHIGSVRYGSRLIDTREAVIPCTLSEAFHPIQCIGGDAGWYRYEWMWSVRGFIDQMLGGVGHRRGRADPRCLLPGDTVGFWRVESMQPDSLLRLSAEMKLPGRAWLQFEVSETGQGTVIRQTALFDPIGIWGLLYWYVLYPLHMLIFKGMLQGIIKAIGKSVTERGDSFNAGC